MVSALQSSSQLNQHTSFKLASAERRGIRFINFSNSHGLCKVEDKTLGMSFSSWGSDLATWAQVILQQLQAHGMHVGG